ncbi:hypothetical protein J7E97_23925 [Streptomyces sp. ISL-66]|uniref:hypothetical protein n=1 Tax=Streptomyces sp. ISL-66 TaxID=2819186 RepID=UPI001BEA4ABF|nr:hypothetical protein [Streptomyces sp. ISL-66]MBT2470831.1 hypothetical protein [Streptomyces sp. ISL-66]
MNDPTLAATEYEEPRGLPDTTDARPPAGATDALHPGEADPGGGPDSDGPDSDGPESGVPARVGPGADGPDAAGQEPRTASQDAGAAPMRTVLESVATGRPVGEVAALVNLLKDSDQHPNPGHTALRAAAMFRPVHEVGEMITLLGRSPHEVLDADITLRAAALGRPIEDVALLVSILGTGAEQAAHPRPVADPARPARSARGALRHVLRWPVALALLICGALHVPGDVAGLTSGDPGGLLALAVTVLCLTTGTLLAVRDTAGAWRAGAVLALGVAVLHVVGGAVEFDPLAGAVGGSVEWAGVTAVLSAAVGAVLAGLALQYRPSADPADGA